jgi:hypothetical protein
MVIVSTKEFRDEQKKYFDLAKEEKVLVKRGKNYVNLIVTKEINNSFFNEKWLKDFFAIPEEYRCNPFDMSPSGDLFYADRRNVEYIQNAIERSKEQVKEGNVTEFNTLQMF